MFIFPLVPLATVVSPEPHLFGLSVLQAMCYSDAEKAAVRAHPSFTEFNKRWNLSVYFQVRVNEIAGVLEKSLAQPITQVAKPQPGQMTLLPSGEVIKTLQLCWSDSIVVKPLVGKFYKLHLQEPLAPT